MLRWLFSILIAAPFALLVVLFAVSNRQTVSLEVFPLPFVIDTPLYMIVLGAMTLGLLAGAVMVWAMGHSARRTARLESKRAQRLEKELAEVRAAALRPTPASGVEANLPLLTG